MHSGMPPEIAPHFMDLLWRMVPKIDDIIIRMPSVNKHINKFKLHATARYVAADEHQEVAHWMQRFDPVTATDLLLLGHVIRFNLWHELAKAMQDVGLAHIPVYQHIVLVASERGPPRCGECKAENEGSSASK